MKKLVEIQYKEFDTTIRVAPKGICILAESLCNTKPIQNQMESNDTAKHFSYVQTEISKQLGNAG